MWLPLWPCCLLPRPWETVKAPRRAEMRRGVSRVPRHPSFRPPRPRRTQCSILPRGTDEGGASLPSPGSSPACLSSGPISQAFPPATHSISISQSLHLSVCISSFSLPWSTFSSLIFSLFLSLSYCIFLSTSLSLLFLSLCLFLLVSLISASS